MKIKINSEAERQQHPLIRYIPSSVWLNIFDQSIDEHNLSFMTKEPESIIAMIDESIAQHDRHDPYKRKRIWFSIAYAHPDMAASLLLQIASKLNLLDKDLMYTAIAFGRDDFFELVFQHIAPEVMQMLSQESEYGFFGSAASYGHWNIMDKICQLVPNKIQEMIAERDYIAFILAAKYGHLHVMDKLFELAPTKVQKMVMARDYGAFSSAAENGHLDVMEKLHKLKPTAILSMISADSHNAFRSAAINGHLHVINRLCELAPTSVQEMITAKNYYAFYWAAARGHLHIMDRLRELAPTKTQEMLEADDYYAFRLAASNGYLNIMDNLRQLAPTKEQEMIAADDYGAFRLAASNGYLNIMERLRELAPTKIQEMIAAKNYLAFYWAAGSGHLDVIDYLCEFAPTQVEEMVTARNYDCFRMAALHGHLPVIERLLEFTPAKEQEMIIADNYTVFRWAARYGHLLIMEKLQKLAPTQVQAMVESNNYESFRIAACNGQLLAINRLVELAPTKVQEMISANNYEAFYLAVREGHLSVIEKLCEFAPNAVPEMTTANHYRAFHSAISRNRLPIIRKLLELSPNLFAYAEEHSYEYSKYIDPFIQKKLQTLRTQKLTAEANHAQVVFDVGDHEARLCFYMLRNIIRRNTQTLQHDDILFLLSIPAIKALAHRAITPNMPNELLRLARTVNNSDAASILLTIPAVRLLAEEHNYYRAEAQGQFDLHIIARDRESSIRNLSSGEQKRLDAALKRYQPVMQKHNGDILFQTIHEALMARYMLHPAQINTGDGRVINLPATWNEWSTLRTGFSVDTCERALKAYYQHKDHTALRYLSKPNHWMSLDADYVCIDPNNTSHRWSTFEEYKPLITMLWLAANDQDILPTDGFTLETRVDHFIDELAFLGRAHNWDRTRIKIDDAGNPLLDEENALIEEEFDDGEGDKPSCYSGVKRRLFQSVLGHPLLKILTLDDIKQELRYFVREYFKQHITDSNRDKLRTAWENLCERQIYDSCLSELNISSEAQDALMQQLTIKYPVQFNDEPAFRNHILNSFQIDGRVFQAHVIRFAAETNLEALLRSSSAQETTPLIAQIDKQETVQSTTLLSAPAITLDRNTPNPSNDSAPFVLNCACASLIMLLSIIVSVQVPEQKTSILTTGFILGGSFLLAHSYFSTKKISTNNDKSTNNKAMFQEEELNIERHMK